MALYPKFFNIIKRQDNSGLTASEGRNPRTGERVQIPASKQPKFKASKALKDAVN